MDKPECQLSETDGNVYAIIVNVAKALKRAGQREKAKEWRTQAMNCTSYDKVLQLAFNYVEVL